MTSCAPVSSLTWRAGTRRSVGAWRVAARLALALLLFMEDIVIRFSAFLGSGSVVDAFDLIVVALGGRM